MQLLLQSMELKYKERSQGGSDEYKSVLKRVRRLSKWYNEEYLPVLYRWLDQREREYCREKRLPLLRYGSEQVLVHYGKAADLGAEQANGQSARNENSTTSTKSITREETEDKQFSKHYTTFLNNPWCDARASETFEQQLSQEKVANNAKSDIKKLKGWPQSFIKLLPRYKHSVWIGTYFGHPQTLKANVLERKEDTSGSEGGNCVEKAEADPEDKEDAADDTGAAQQAGL